MPDYSSLVEFIVKRLVTHPDDVQVTSSSDEEGVIRILISVRQEDIGRVIGKRGATINAIRLVTKASAVKCSERVDVDIQE